MNETITNARRVNRAAVRAYALRCSENLRAGKFTRVGEDFFEEIEADVERILREVRIKFPTMHPAVTLGEEPANIVTGEFMQVMRFEIDDAVRRLIQNKVQRQPSVGCTLGATR